VRELTRKELELVSGGAQFAHINKSNINIKIKDDDLKLHLIINNKVILRLKEDDLKIHLIVPI